MKRLLTLLAALLAGYNSYAKSADTVTSFMDFNWKKCNPDKAVYFRVAWKEGEWWRVRDHYLNNGGLQMDGVFASYEKGTFGQMQGMFYYYHRNGELSSKIRYVNDKREGVYKAYDTTGHLVDSVMYKNGEKYKTGLIWYSSGVVAHKEINDEKGTGKSEIWNYFEDSTVSSHGNTTAGGGMDSTWSYFRRNGKLSCKDYYKDNKRIKRECFDENGNIVNGSCDDRMAGFNKEFRKQVNNIFYHALYGEDKVLLPLKGKVHGVMVLQICVDEAGTVTVDVIAGVNTIFDNFIRTNLANLPKVTPFIEGNRPVSDCEEFPFPVNY